MTGKIGPRCPAEHLTDARPLLAAVAAAKVAGRPVPETDWQCVREPHGDRRPHLCMPIGPAGPSVRFAGELVQPGTCPTCSGPSRVTVGMVCQHCGTDYDPPADDPDTYHERGVYCGEPAHCFEPYPGADPGTPYPAEPAPAPAPMPRADPDDVRRLIEIVQAPGTTAVHVNDGDELLLLLPDADEKAVETSAQALADLFPTVTFLVLAGVTGAVVMPPRRVNDTPTYADLLASHDDMIARRDRLILQGVNPDDLTVPIRPLDDQA